MTVTLCCLVLQKFLRLTLALSVMVMWALAEFADYGYQQYGHTQVDYHVSPAGYMIIT